MFGSWLRSKPRLAERLETYLGRTILRIRRLERREAPQPGDVVRGRTLRPLAAEQLVEPPARELPVHLVGVAARVLEDA